MSILSARAKIGNNPNSFNSERLDKLWYIYTTEYYLQIKNKLLIQKTWMNVKGIMLSGKSQHEKVTYYTIQFLYTTPKW